MSPENLTEPHPESNLSSNLIKVLGDELAQLKIGVEKRAHQIASERAKASRKRGAPEGDRSLNTAVEMEDLTHALDESLGKKSAEVSTDRFWDLFPPFTVLCFVLCLIFGYFGIYNSDKNTGFLDIAKIFAGALVGSATSNRINTIRSNRRAH
jgi:hypothetical protein